MANCPHKEVEYGKHAEGRPVDGWYCIKCNRPFFPADAIEKIEEENDRIIDMVTGVFTATIWGLHQHAAAAGVDLPDQPPNLSEARCEEDGHDVQENGTCSRCGFSPFLGGAG